MKVNRYMFSPNYSYPRNRRQKLPCCVAHGSYSQINSATSWAKCINILFNITSAKKSRHRTINSFMMNNQDIHIWLIYLTLFPPFVYSHLILSGLNPYFNGSLSFSRNYSFYDSVYADRYHINCGAVRLFSIFPHLQLITYSVHKIKEKLKLLFCFLTRGCMRYWHTVSGTLTVSVASSHCWTILFDYYVAGALVVFGLSLQKSIERNHIFTWQRTEVDSMHTFHYRFFFFICWLKKVQVKFSVTICLNYRFLLGSLVPGGIEFSLLNTVMVSLYFPE